MRPSSTRNSVTCETTHLTEFGANFAVAPNKIDWDFVFSNMDFFTNPTLYITQMIIAVAYILAAIWARRHDNKVQFKVSAY